MGCQSHQASAPGRSLLAGVLIRVEDVPRWAQHRTRAFMHDGRPVLIDFDSYYYLRLAVDLRNGQYARWDPLRATSQRSSQALAPPLLPCSRPG